MIVGKCYNNLINYIMKDGPSLMWTADRDAALDIDPSRAQEMAPMLETKLNIEFRYEGKVWTEEK